MGNLVYMRGDIMKKIGLVLLAVLLFGFVLAGCDDGDKDKEEEKPKETGFTVKVENIPSMVGENKLYGASLMASTAPDTPIAIGMLNNGVFTFFIPASTSSGIPLPDTSKPFTTAGNYMLFIAETKIKINEDGTPQYEIGATYMYMSGQPQGTITFSETNKNVTLAWSDFQQTPSQP